MLVVAGSRTVPVFVLVFVYCGQKSPSEVESIDFERAEGASAFHPWLDCLNAVGTAGFHWIV